MPEEDTTPALPDALAPSAAAPRTSTRRPTRLLAAASLVVAAVIGVVAVVSSRSGESSRPTAATTGQAPVARIVARIPLGMAKYESPTSLTFLGRTVWVTTSFGRLVRVDARTNQVVGNAVSLGQEHLLFGAVASGESIYTTSVVLSWVKRKAPDPPDGRTGWISRIDAHTGRVMQRRRLPGSEPGGLTVAGGVLWVASNSGEQRRGALYRLNPRTLRDTRPSVKVAANLTWIAVRGSRVWALADNPSSGQVVRIDATTGERRIAHIGVWAARLALDGKTLWVTDAFNGTVSALDAEQMVVRREAIKAPRSAYGLAVTGSHVWTTSVADFHENGPVRLERFETHSSRREGKAVKVGAGGGDALQFALGSLWVTTETALVRLTPNPPPPAPEPAGFERNSTRAFAPGPMPSATWRTTTFAAPFTFSTTAFAWIGVFPTFDGVDLIATGEQETHLDIYAPRQVYDASRKPRPVTGPSALLKALRDNPRLIVGPVHHVAVGGRPAMQFELRARRPAAIPDVCGARHCVLLFPLKDNTVWLLRGDVVRFSLLRSGGRTIVISEGGDGYDKASLATTASALKTFRFKP